MRKYTRKNIHLNDISVAAIKQPMKASDQLRAEAAEADAWLIASKRKENDDDNVFVGLTYTVGLAPMKKHVKKGEERTVITVRKAKGERERHGRLFLHGKWAE